MGNHISNRRPPPSAAGKVILADGSVHHYDAPLTVAELMLEYPQQFVVEFQSVAVAGKRPAPLPADKKLERDKLYIMLPVKRGKPASLTPEESRQLLFRANKMLKSPNLFASTTGILPFFAKICPAGNWVDAEKEIPARKTEELTQKSSEKENFSAKEDDYFSQILEERPEYLSKQVSGKGWKPSLDTITEKSMKIKVRHWLY